MSTAKEEQEFKESANHETSPTKGRRIIADMLRRIKEAHREDDSAWKDYSVWVNSWREHNYF